MDPELLRDNEAEVVKQHLGEEAWHQARGPLAANADN